MSTSEKQILVLGGGFAGVYTARCLERLLRPEEASITLITRENYWVYQPMLPEVISGSIGLTNIGRSGWAEFFVARGYTVFMIDQPARGRSAWQPEIDGKLTSFAAERIEQLFTAPETLGNWPQAKKHTQWPSGGRIGDPVFDAFYATQVQYIADNAETQRLNQAPGAALLDRIGPAIIL